ncbi:MAG: hypothetical protein FD122_2337 [Stygiobacter sp.]|nr:MAG: hypothetical protein FD122_2337 [Stygiobacter sp.]
MRKHILPLLVILVVSFSVVIVLKPHKGFSGRELSEEEKKTNDALRKRQEFLMLRDIRTNKIPDDIYVTEQIFAKKLPKRLEFASIHGVLAKNAVSLTWDERGPNNVGGRVRAFGIDVSDANILVAGGISGGIWKSTNDGTSWSKKTSSSQLHSVSCLIQDYRTGKTNIWYAGSGEGVGNSADGGGSASYRGDGIFKSTDNGDSWTVLSSTTTANTPHTTENFDYVWDVAIDPNNAAQDVVYAATTRGIWKSTDGGTTWAVKLGNVVGTYPTYSTVKVAPNGTVYAAANSGSNMAGIYKSTDSGENWTNITSGSFPSNYARLVLEISDDSNILYVFGNTPSAGQDGDGGKADQYVSLWHYNVGSGTWTNRSANLPAFVDPVAGLNPQGSYNMMLRLKPGTTDFLVIGATNLYVSSDGFATNGNTSWVGGYATANNISQYANHHSDQHAGAFGSGNVYYSCNDGGVQKTSNISAGSGLVSWTSLDNGLNITQCYSVAIEREASRNLIFSGFQDNACWFGNSAGASSWTNAGSGDGAVVAVGNASTDNVIFSTSQNGGLDRYTKTGSYLGDMKPSSAAHQAFTNPLALDPNSSSLLYYGGGNSATTTGIWRNNDALNGTTTTGWSYITGTDFGSTSATVSAIAVSNDNVVYYGSDEGHVRKITSANGTPAVSANLNGSLPGGYVSGLAVDPTNSDKAIAVFSNYGIVSVWYTIDGGANWTDVEGNLSGASGPSIRSAKIFYISGTLHVFLGTSVGIYYTNILNGSSTVWTQEAVTSIGNVVVPALDFRSSDNTLAAGTHGRGVFTSLITAALPVELISFTGMQIEGEIQLTWQTATEVNNYGFNVERSSTSPGMTWEKIGFVQGHGNSNSTKSYSFTDKNAPSGKVHYRLKQIDFDGKYEYSNIVEVNVNALNRLELAQNFPNPFNPVTTINYTLPNVSKVKLVIYDVTGREVATLVNEFQSAGKHSVNFNASRIASGVYYYRIQAGDIIQTKKMILMK